jgi:hypothetical protein
VFWEAIVEPVFAAASPVFAVASPVFAVVPDEELWSV